MYSAQAHFSAVRSVCWAESFPLTLGLDRRLRLWNEDQLKAEWVTCCTELLGAVEDGEGAQLHSEWGREKRHEKTKRIKSL